MKLVKNVDDKNLDTKKVSDKEAEEAIRTILSWMGEDPKREGLLETPKKVIKAFKEYFQGYNEDAKKVLDKTFGDHVSDNSIDFSGRSLPFRIFGKYC